MNEIVYNIWPNIQYYLSLNKIFFIVFHIIVTTLLALCIFFLYKIIRLYWILKKEKQKIAIFIADIKLFYQNQLKKQTGITLIKDFLNYVEINNIKGSYKDLDDILLNIGFNKFEIKIIKRPLYQDFIETQEAEELIRKKIINM